MIKNVGMAIMIFTPALARLPKTNNIIAWAFPTLATLLLAKVAAGLSIIINTRKAALAWGRRRTRRRFKADARLETDARLG
eukprot:CAMPEP_0178479056 /NCGR_PEP_ID=MMETSP0696-20121128/4981_1 /TAXON_ID=265572 /ORGANISM="Extubocellulus spinifer, Strain CCMP396" /LENGTH=80 /DNA_ID=CAMNT_0020106449 /DNA_START=645 /DNA_END=884 /DNA_ORIENTATION=+